MHMPAAQQEIEQLKRRLEVLQEEAEEQLRQKLAEARKVVTDLEMQLSEITGRPSATMIKAADPKRWPPVTDEQLEVMILFLLQKEGQDGMNAKTIAERLNQNPVRIRQWVKDNPTVLKRVGKGPGTKFFIP
jgi:predicted RNase H-like nuclease (RuvC/YqgF family)